jgi:hypothetical protein
MTADQAIASMWEDIARLEAKDLVKPNYIQRKKDEVDAIVDEITALGAKIQQLEKELEKKKEAQQESDLRIGMLANVLTMVGLDPLVHLRRPISNAEVYRRAAEYVCWVESEHRKRLPGKMPFYTDPYEGRTLRQQKEIIANATWWARLQIHSEQTEKLADAYKKEDRRAA